MTRLVDIQYNFILCPPIYYTNTNTVSVVTWAHNITEKTWVVKGCDVHNDRFHHSVQLNTIQYSTIKTKQTYFCFRA